MSRPKAIGLVPYVAAGGALGSMLRHAVDVFVDSAGGGVGVALLGVNLVGAFLLGVVVARFDPRGRPEDVEDSISQLGGRERMLAFLGAGVLGSLTTYSGMIEWLGRESSTGPDWTTVLQASVMLLVGPVMVVAGLACGRKGGSAFVRRPSP